MVRPKEVEEVEEEEGEEDEDDGDNEGFVDGVDGDADVGDVDTEHLRRQRRRPIIVSLPQSMLLPSSHMMPMQLPLMMQFMSGLLQLIMPLMPSLTIVFDCT